MKPRLKIYSGHSRSGEEEIKDLIYIMFLGPDEKGKEAYMVHPKGENRFRVPQYLIDGTWGEIIYT